MLQLAGQLQLLGYQHKALDLSTIAGPNSEIGLPLIASKYMSPQSGLNPVDKQLNKSPKADQH